MNPNSAIYVVDIDGTVADATDRLHLVKCEEPNWKEFLNPALMIKDKPYPHAKHVLNRLRYHGNTLVFITGRNERLRDVTEEWLSEHLDRQRDIRWGEQLLMRGKDHENTAASVYKKSQLSKVQYTYGVRRPYFFFEDDPFVARMYRAYGIVFKAPDCWASMDHGLTDEEEPIWRF